MPVFSLLSAFLIAGFSSRMLLAQAPNLSGSWISQSDSAIKWIFVQDPQSIHVQEINNGKTEADFTCPLGGTACTVKENRREEKIMMYFNGAKLVQIRERGDDVVKQRLAVSADGKTLTVETIPMAVNQKATTLSFRRQP